MNITNLLNAIQDGLKNGTRFVSFCYCSKESRETAIYTISLGVKIENAYKRDLKILPLIQVKTEAEKIARREIFDSIKESLTNGVGNNHNYKQKGLYLHICPGVKLNQASGDLTLFGMVVNKQVVKEGEHKAAKSSEKTIAKMSIRKKLKCGKFRNFLLTSENIAGIKHNGRILQIQN